MWVSVPVLLSLALLIGVRSGWGCPLPVTGQTTCWDSSGSVIPCAGTGQDGELRKGAPLAYVDNGDGTITDVNTGLMWEKLSHDGTVHDDHNQYTWATAYSGHVGKLNNASFAGHNDWRLPNVRELLSIATYQDIEPTVAPAFDNRCSAGCSVTTCSCTFSGDTWTSTLEAASPTKQWFVDFQDAQVGTGLENGVGPVRAVRDVVTGCRLPASGQTTCWDTNGNVISCAGTGEDGAYRSGAPLAYADNGDGTVADLNTGLVWEKLSDDGTVHDKDNAYTWANAFAGHVATLNATSFAGHNDWRLPNARELESIVNYQTSSPIVSAAFNTNCAPGCQATSCSCTALGPYWSSTSSVSSPARAWFVSFRYGTVDAFNTSGSKSVANFVRAVRTGSGSTTTTTSPTTTSTTTMPSCQGQPNGTACDDGNPCTSGDTCQSGLCGGVCQVGRACGGGCVAKQCGLNGSVCSCRSTATTSSTTTPTTTTSTTTPSTGTCSSPIVVPAGGGTFSGTTSGSSTLAGTCAATSSAPEKVYRWTPSGSGVAIIQTCGTATTFDTVLYIRGGACATGSELVGGCNDDACANATGLLRASRITPTVTAGQTYFIVVDGWSTSGGSFTLSVTAP